MTDDGGRGRTLRVFFDFTDGSYTTHDSDGHECADADEARIEALKALPEVLLSDPRDSDERKVICRVRDGCGAILYQVSITLQGRRFPGR